MQKKNQIKNNNYNVRCLVVSKYRRIHFESWNIAVSSLLPANNFPSYNFVKTHLHKAINRLTPRRVHSTSVEVVIFYNSYSTK